MQSSQKQERNGCARIFTNIFIFELRNQTIYSEARNSICFFNSVRNASIDEILSSSHGSPAGCPERMLFPLLNTASSASGALYLPSDQGGSFPGIKFSMQPTIQ